MNEGDRKAGVSRRTVVQGAAAASAASAASLLGFLGCDKAARQPARPGDAPAAPELGFTPVPTSRADAVVVPPGYRYQVVNAWGDPVVAGAPAFRPDADAADAGAAAGMGHDGMAFFPLPPSPSGADRGLLAVNFEYTDDNLLHPNGMEPWTADKVAKSKNAHGVGILEVAAEAGSWRVVPGSRYGRRITADTPIALAGPAAGHALDEDRRRSRRADGARHLQQLRLRPDALGHVPVLRGERHARTSSNDAGRAHAPCRSATASAPSKDSWGFRWQEFDPRFDAARHPNEPNRHGWVVEIDPFDPDVAARQAHRAGADGARRRDRDAGARRPRRRLHGRRRLPHRSSSTSTSSSAGGRTCPEPAPPRTAICWTTGRCTSRASTPTAPASGCRCAHGEGALDAGARISVAGRGRDRRAHGGRPGGRHVHGPARVDRDPPADRRGLLLAHQQQRARQGQAAAAAPRRWAPTPPTRARPTPWATSSAGARRTATPAAPTLSLGHLPAGRRSEARRSAQARQRRRAASPSPSPTASSSTSAACCGSRPTRRRRTWPAPTGTASATTRCWRPTRAPARCGGS